METHEIVDIEFGILNVEGNPFDADFRAILTGPDGALLAVPGFYDDDRGFVVRVSIPRPGPWRVTFRSSVPDLNSGEVGLDAVASTNPNEHGALNVDRLNPHHFVRDDGSRYFFRGYEVDWLLLVDQGDADLTRVKAFVESITSAGFTAVTVNAYAHSFRQYVPPELEGDERWILPSIAPWAGGNDNPDYEKFDPAFFAHMDRVIGYLHSQGVLTHLMIHVYNKDVNWPELGTPDDDRYWRQILSRYQAFSSIVWDTAKESYHRPADYIWTRIAIIRQQDAYRRLVTAHDANPPKNVQWGRQYVHPHNEYIDALTDFTADQILQDIYEDAVEHALRDSKPYVNIEYAYESGIEDLPSDATDHDQDWQEVARRTWQVVMGGAYPNYYYRNTAWSLFLPFPEPPGYAAFRVLADFWDATPYWRLTPSDHLTGAHGRVFCRAESGSEYIAYSETGIDFDLDIEGEELNGFWMSPYSGERVAVGSYSTGRHGFSPPWENQPAVLRLSRHL